MLISTQPSSTVGTEISAGQQPPRDYDALRQALNADAIYPYDALKFRYARFIKRIFGARIALAWAGFCLRHTYDILYTDTEIVGLPLAMFLTLGGSHSGHPRHVTLSHYLSPFKKRIFFYLGMHGHLDTVIVHCEAQRVLAMDHLHMPAARVVKLPYFVDYRFWRLPDAVESNAGSEEKEQLPMICAAGLEFRDYPTLLRAVDGLSVHVQIAAGSAPEIFLAASNLRRMSTTHLPALPSNVSVDRYDYAGMRQLYSAARFVVVPLCQKDAPAGVTVILEAMAMGKAVIVSGTRGQTDVLRDPRNEGRGLVVRDWWPGFLDVPEIAGTLGSLPTGFYVTPGDPDELRERIQYLLDHPDIAEELGRNGRRIVEAYFGLDAFAQRFAAAIRGEPHPELACLSHTGYRVAQES